MSSGAGSTLAPDPPMADSDLLGPLTAGVLPVSMISMYSERR